LDLKETTYKPPTKHGLVGLLHLVSTAIAFRTSAFDQYHTG